MMAPSASWIAIAQIYNRLVRLAKEAAKKKKKNPKMIRLPLSHDEARRLKALFLPHTQSYKKLNSKQWSSNKDPFLALNSEQALILAGVIRKHLEGGVK